MCNNFYIIIKIAKYLFLYFEHCSVLIIDFDFQIAIWDLYTHLYAHFIIKYFKEEIANKINKYTNKLYK